jgi:alkylation response protein AidB-like acyl-CoA dehydrogenase
MDVRLSAEQIALRDTVVQVAGRHGLRTVADLDDEARRARLESAVVAAGWREIRADDGYGSPLASGVEVSIIAEELGRCLADVAYIGPMVASELRRLAGAEMSEQRETVALDASLSNLAVDDGALHPDAFAIDAEGSVAALVLVSEGDKFALATTSLVVHDDHPDLTRASASPDPATAPVALPGTRLLSSDEVLSAVALGLVVACSDLVGVMRGTTKLASDYAAERRQYGVPVGSFQAVQHILADAYVSAEGAASVTLHAAWAVDALGPLDALAAAVAAKAYCARASRVVCETSIQVHGGIGNTWECLAHLFLRRALFSSELFGGVGVSLDRLLAHRGIGQTGSVVAHGLR